MLLKSSVIGNEAHATILKLSWACCQAWSTEVLHDDL